MKTPNAIVLLLLCPTLGIAQPVGDAAECAPSDSAPPTAPLLIDEAIASALQEARQCLENLDADCAETAIAPLNPDEMQGNARGALGLVAGDIAVVNNDLAAAEREYRDAPADPVMHAQIRRGAATRLGIVYLRRGTLEQLLQHITSLDCDERSAELSFLKASAQFESGDHDNALATINLAIDAQSADGSFVPESWYSVRDASLQSLAGGELFCETETPLGSHIPIEQCYTSEELRQIAACQRTARAQRSINPMVECSIR